MGRSNSSSVKDSNDEWGMNFVHELGKRQVRESGCPEADTSPIDLGSYPDFLAGLL